MTGVPRKSVLIVEDDAFLAKAYEMRFANVGIDTVVAGTGNEVLTMLLRQPPDAVILDILLPDIGGFEVLEKMKRADGWAHVPVIIVSNLSQDVHLARGKKLGAVRYVVKADTKIDDIISITTSHFA